jgi:two-component system phosphate regulon response regulator PhoB
MAKKILIVEDDTFLQGLAATKMTKEGYTVSTASNVGDVDKFLETDAPDFVLLDLVLPGTDGFGILKKLRENPKTAAIPVIIFSNLAEDKDIMKAKELGATDFMIKSNFTLDELAEKVKSLIG